MCKTRVQSQVRLNYAELQPGTPSGSTLIFDIELLAIN